MYTLIFILLIASPFAYFILKYEGMKLEKRQAREKHEQEEREKEERQERERKNIETEINDLADSIIADWNNSIYADKVETPGTQTVTYKFENGNTVFLQGNTLIYTTSTRKITYTIGLIYKSRFTTIFNRIVEIINSGQTAKRSKSYSYSSSSKYSDGGKTYSAPSNKTAPVSSRQKRYDTIMETIKLRKEGLAKMSKNDPSRPALENELKAAEKKAAEIKMELQN